MGKIQITDRSLIERLRQELATGEAVLDVEGEPFLLVPLQQTQEPEDETDLQALLDSMADDPDAILSPEEARRFIGRELSEPDA